MKKFAAMADLSGGPLAGCDGTPASAPTVTVTATSTATPSTAPAKTAAPKATTKATLTPAPVKTSGGYGADLAAVGVVPVGVARYGQSMKEQLCDSPLPKTRLFGYSESSNSVRTLGSGADHVASTRLSIAYFRERRRRECPTTATGTFACGQSRPHLTAVDAAV